MHNATQCKSVQAQCKTIALTLFSEALLDFINRKSVEHKLENEPFIYSREIKVKGDIYGACRSGC